MELNPAFASDDALTVAVLSSSGPNGTERGDKQEKAAPRPMLNIDPSGDVALVLGETSLRVSSKVLSVASPVFRAMFGPYFQEGESLSRSNSTAPAMITLPDDDPDAMCILCQILHLQNDPIPEVLLDESIMGLRKLAVVCDKYNCVSAVRFHTNVWIDKLESFLEGKVGNAELFNIVECAYILDHAALFERATMKILMNDIGGILDRIIGWSTDDILPIKVYGELEKRRRNLYTELSNGLQDPIAHLVGKSECEVTTTLEAKQYGSINHTWHKFNLHDALQVSAYIRELRRVSLWPLDPQKHKLAAMIKAFHKFEDRDISQSMGFAIFPRSSQCQACMLDTRSKVANLMGKLLKGCKGLCLDCIDKDRLGSEEVECRVTHE